MNSFIISHPFHSAILPLNYAKYVGLMSFELGQKRLWRESINDIGHGVWLLVVTSLTHDALPATREYIHADTNTVSVDRKAIKIKRKNRRRDGLS